MGLNTTRLGKPHVQSPASIDSIQCVLFLEAIPQKRNKLVDEQEGHDWGRGSEGQRSTMYADWLTPMRGPERPLPSDWFMDCRGVTIG